MKFAISGSGLTLVDPDTRQELPLSARTIIVTAADGGLLINKKRLSLPIVVVKSSSGKLECNGKEFPQGLIISYIRKGTCSCTPFVPENAEQKTSSCTVKVLLDEKGKREKAKWIITAKERILILNPKDSEKRKLLKDPKVELECKGGRLYINGRHYSDDSCFISSPDNHVSLDGTRYHGSLFITSYKGSFLIINYVPLEEYIVSVLRTESWPGWPLEVNKAFAITSRSYVIAMILGAKKNEKPFHVKNTNIHQTYRGAHSNKSLKDAVTQTEGVFLAFNGMPITAMFDSCCGGIVPAYVHGFDFKKAPYLARPYACTFCKECKLFSWQAEYDAHVLAGHLASLYDAREPIRGIKISKKDKAGLVKEIQVRGHKSHKHLTVKQLYSCLKEVKSFCFSAQYKANKVILKGKGYGHHLGLCQWGAREMVRQGWDYKSILQFYYPGTTFMKLR